MSLTISGKELSAMANKHVVMFDIAFDSSYPTGGESLTSDDLGLQNIDFISIPAKDGYLFEYDYTNSKVKAYTPVGAVSDTLAASVDSGSTGVTSSAVNGAIITLSGTAGVSAAAGAEVSNATDLSGVTSVKAMAIGY